MLHRIFGSLGFSSLRELLDGCHKVLRRVTKYEAGTRTHREYIYTAHSLETFEGQCKRARAQLCERRQAVTTAKVRCPAPAHPRLAVLEAASAANIQG